MRLPPWFFPKLQMQQNPGDDFFFWMNATIRLVEPHSGESIAFTSWVFDIVPRQAGGIP